MKKNIFITFVVLIAPFFLKATNTSNNSLNKTIVKGNGEVITISKKVDNYEEIIISSSIDVKLVNGEEGNLSIEIESNLQEYLEIKTSNEQLVIKWKKNSNIHTRKRVTVTVPVKSIDQVDIIGSGDLFSEELFNLKNLSLNIIGSGDITLNINVENLSANINGSGDIDLTGKAEKAEYIIHGSGDIRANSFKTLKTTATISGSGDITLFASDDLEATVNGSGNIVYKGSPKNKNLDRRGSGNIVGRD